MEPFVVDPETFHKETALRAAVTYVEAFLDLNGIPRVREYLFAPDDSKKPPGKNPWHDNGWYWRGALFVNLKRSRVPVKAPGFSWSFTGFKADLTAPGILAHETGHHVHFELEKRLSTELRKGLMDCLGYLKDNETAVSGYEPNLHEVMAEAMRLFIMNPTLLREGRPERFRFLTDHLGLRALHDAPWRDVLRNAHPRIIAAAEGWIKR